MSKITCIIVEDEPLAAKVLSGYIAQISYLELRDTFKNALLAAEYLRLHSVDLIFLDIHLPKLKGMDFLKMLRTSSNLAIFYNIQTAASLPLLAIPTPGRQN